MTYRGRFSLFITIGMIALHMFAIVSKISHPQPVGQALSPRTSFPADPTGRRPAPPQIGGIRGAMENSRGRSILISGS